MNFEDQLVKLMIAGSPEVDSLRLRAINGNKSTLQSFCHAIQQMLKDQKLHPVAYKQVNSLLLTARPEIATRLNFSTLPIIANQHKRQDLNQYILFWQKIMPGSNRVLIYPNLKNTFRKIGAELQPQSKSRQKQFANLLDIFESNLKSIQQQKVQFFEDESFTSQNANQTNHDIIELDMQQIKQIRKILQKNDYNPEEHRQFIIKARNFMNHKQNYVKKQLVNEFVDHQKWCRQFIQQHQEEMSIPKNKNMKKNVDKKVYEDEQQIEVEVDSDDEVEKKNSGRKLRGHMRKYSQQDQVQVQVQDDEVPSSKKVSKKGSQIKPEQTKVKISRKPQQVKVNVSNGNIYIDQNEVEEAIFEEEKVRPTISKRITSLDEKKLQGIGHKNIKADKHDKQQIQKHLFTLAGNKMQQSFYDESNYNRNSGIKQPNFILDAEQLKKFEIPNSPMKSSNFSKTRPKIFGNQNRISQISLNPLEPDQQKLQVIKHGHQSRQDSNFFDNFILNNANKNVREEQGQRKPRNSMKFEQNQNLLTPMNNKNLDNMPSPSTAFMNKTGLSTTNKKKFSEFNQEKRQRKMGLENEQITLVQSYLYAPYYQYFPDNTSFSRFRRNCLQNSLTLHTSSCLLITCTIEQDSEQKLRVEIRYYNKTSQNILVQTIYKIPKCLRIQKQTEIKKRFIIQDQIVHKFTIQLLEFPLQACVMMTKYTFSQHVQDIKNMEAMSILLPITIRNFLNYFVLNQSEWLDGWRKWSESGYFRTVKNIFLQGAVVHEEQLASALTDFSQLNPIEGYSVKQFAAFCIQPKFNNLGFLLRISQRVESIITFQLLANKKQISTNESDYLQYCLSFWSMLLAKI